MITTALVVGFIIGRQSHRFDRYIEIIARAHAELLHTYRTTPTH